MSRFVTMTSSADPQRAIPESPAARLDRIDSALASLAEEQRRLERLGFELPLARCHQQIRYWRFLKGLCSVASDASDGGRETR